MFTTPPLPAIARWRSGSRSEFLNPKIAQASGILLPNVPAKPARVGGLKKRKDIKS